MPIGRREFVRLTGAAAIALAGVSAGKDIPFAVYLPRTEASPRERLDGSVRKQLDALILATRERKTWNGVKVVFSGPAGSGRTLAAQVLASEAGRDLYAVDLDRVISKYIGETEKNLERVFDAAEHAQAVLFFDEADELFGERTEAADTKDRYANPDVTYLMKRLEVFEGMAIIATNSVANIDETLVRSSDAVITFSARSPNAQ